MLTAISEAVALSSVQGSGVMMESDRATVREQVEWATYLFHELDRQYSFSIKGRDQRLAIGLALELASTDPVVLQLAAEAHNAGIKDVHNLVSELVYDFDGRDGFPKLRFTALYGGKLTILPTPREVQFGRPIAPFTEYASNATIHDSAVERFGLRDLNQFKGQFLTQNDLEMYGEKFLERRTRTLWPSKPLPSQQTETTVGSVRSVDIDKALAAVKKAGAVVYGRAASGTVFLKAHPNFREKAINAIKEDAKKNGYQFVS